MAADPLLSIENLSVQFPGKNTPLFEHVSFQIPPGVIFGLLGETGCGKSTIGKIISGFLPRCWYQGRLTLHDPGKVWRLDQLAEKTWQHQIRGRQVVYVPQDPYQALNPYEPIKAGLQRVSASPAAALQQVGLPPELLPAYPSALSAGQCQRVMLAMAMACQARLLILDEPVASIDQQGRQAILPALRQYAQKTGTVLIISHEQDTLTALLTPGNHFNLSPATSGQTAPPQPPSSPSGSPEPLLQLANICQSYAGHCVLDNIALSIKPGEWIYLAGANGAGKSTLLGILAGRLKPQSGTIQWQGQPIEPRDWPRYSGAYVHLISQNNDDDLDPCQRIAAIVAEPLEKVRPSLRTQLRVEQEQLWEILELPAQLKQQRPPQLSYGQQKRIVLLRGWLKYRRRQLEEPVSQHLLLLDEIFSGIHWPLRNKIITYFLEQRQQGIAPALLWVAHGHQQLQQYCQTHLHLIQGQLSPWAPTTTKSY